MPKHILEKAFRSKSNELAWKKEDLSEAIDAIINLRCDISGGDIWIINNNRIMEIPGFSSDYQRENEPLKDYTKRVKDEFLGWVEIMEKSSNKEMENKNNVYYTCSKLVYKIKTLFGLSCVSILFAKNCKPI